MNKVIDFLEMAQELIRSVKHTDAVDALDAADSWINKAVEEISAAPPVTGGAWLPIESAPEGKDILVYCQETGECFVVFWALQVDTRKGDWVIARANDGTCFICKNPTHWQPLPAPPSSADKEGV